MFGNSKRLSLSWNNSCIFSRRGFVYFAYLRKGHDWDCELWYDYGQPSRLSSLVYIGV